MSVIGGRVVLTPDARRPYKVVLQYDHGAADSEHPVATVREGELLIRRKSPSRPEPDSSRWNLSAPAIAPGASKPRKP